MLKRAPLALVVVFLLSPPAFGWGRLGHRVVATIGQERMSDSGRKKALALLGGKSFADVANDPDQWLSDPELKETAKWHFVNIPRDSTYDAQRDCSAPQLCVIEALELNREILQDSSKPRADRREALIFIIHFVGDLHQPLHCADGTPSDRGGGLVPVAFFGDSGKDGRMNLHKVWDSEILTNQLDEEGLDVSQAEDEAKFVSLIESRESQDAATIAQGTPTDWAEDAHEKANQFAYEPLPKKSRKLGRPNIQQDYVDQATPVIDDQLLFAGIRLAAYLDAALGGD